jgi:DNA (cytosine-5)-methyltransferase 1
MGDFTHLSLFTGIGGLDLAAEWAGFSTVGQCEWADYPTKVLEKHWPDVPRWRDIRSLTGDSFYDRAGLRTVDLISGGFPCQPFSNAGKRRSTEDDRFLWPEMLRVIGEIKPTWVVGENVAGIINLALDDVLSDLESKGYETQTFVIPACGVDAPHRRERVAIIAHTNCDRGRSWRPESKGQQRQTRLADGGEILAHSHIQRSQGWNRRILQECSGERAAGQSGSLLANSECTERRPGKPGGYVTNRENAGWPEAASRAGASGANGYSGIMADSHGKWEQQPEGEQRKGRGRTGHGGEDVADTTRELLHRDQREPGRCPEFTDGSWWEVEPDVGRVADGVSHRVDRLRCLGNAVVPQQFYPILRAIAEIMRGAT